MKSSEIWYVYTASNLLFIPLSIGKILIRDIRTDEKISIINLHESEVSCILTEENSLFCGSFDGSISYTDLRNFSCVGRVDIGGGVWRAIRKGTGFITANMEEGFKYTNSGVRSQILTESLAYGIANIDKNVYIGCSFYDSKLIKFELL